MSVIEEPRRVNADPGTTVPESYCHSYGTRAWLRCQRCQDISYEVQAELAGYTLDGQRRGTTQNEQSFHDVLQVFRAGHVPLLPTSWRIGKLMPESGVLLVVGPAKDGKSCFMRQMAAAMPSGGDFLGSKIEIPANVLYLCAGWSEDNPRSVSDKLARLAPGGGVYVGYLRNDSMALNQMQGRSPAEWAELVAAHARDVEAGVVIIDMLRGVLPPTVDYADYGVMSASVAAFASVARDKRLSVVLLHHARKDIIGRIDPILHGLGSAAIGGSVDVALGIQANHSKRTSLVVMKGRDVGERELNLTFDPTTETFARGDLLQATMADPFVERVYGVLVGTEQAISARDLAERLGESRERVRKALLALEAESRAEIHGKRNSPKAGWAARCQSGGGTDMASNPSPARDEGQ